MRDVALAYAAKGFRVFPLYGCKGGECVNPLTGEICTIHKTGSAQRSKGKHPLEVLAPHGAISGTVDTATIASWPDRPYNLGLSLSETLIALDIDDTETADKILEAYGSSEKVLISRTGRGMHLLVNVEATKGTDLISQGIKIGDIRAHNKYIALPPSEHYLGTPYQWLNRSIVDDDAVPTFKGTGQEYARALLASIGLPLDEKAHTVIVPEATGPIPSAPPFDVPEDATILRALLTGHMPTNDRSEALYRLGCELWRVAPTNTQPLTIAGIIKGVDARQYKKFTDRSDADVRYWEIAHRSQADVLVESAPPSTPTSPSGEPEQHSEDADGNENASPSARFSYTPETGLILKGKTPTLIANFKAEIKENRLLWVDGEEEPVREWRVELTKGDSKRELTVEAEDFEPRLFVARLRKSVPSNYIVTSARNSVGMFLEATQWFSGDAPERHVYAAPGWHPERDIFLLPGLPAAITADGYDPATVFEAAGKTPPMMASRRQIATDARLPSIFRLLLDVAPARIVMPILTQILAAPLCSVGLNERTILFVLGPTQSFKTSICTSLQGLYGWANPEAIGITTWSGSTQMACRDVLYWQRDLPALIDDYKIGLTDDRIVANIIQSYGDLRGRDRMTKDMRRGQSRPPRCTAIGTGEDSIANQRSTMARTLFVHVAPGDMKLEGPTGVKELRRHAANGELGALGVAWIRWLCQQGRSALAQEIDDGISSNYPNVVNLMGHESERLTMSVTALFTVMRLFLRFIKDVCPEMYDEVRDAANTGWLQQFASAKEQSEEAKEMSPLTQITAMVREAVQSGRGCLAPKSTKHEFVGTQHSRVIGWASDTTCYITQNTTYAWMLEELARQRANPTFSWNQVIAEVRSTYGKGNEREWLGTDQIRALSVPLPVVMES